jgi:hypothetical protein
MPRSWVNAQAFTSGDDTRLVEKDENTEDDEGTQPTGQSSTDPAETPEPDQRINTTDGDGDGDGDGSGDDDGDLGNATNNTDLRVGRNGGDWDGADSGSPALGPITAFPTIPSRARESFLSLLARGSPPRDHVYTTDSWTDSPPYSFEPEAGFDLSSHPVS